MTQTKKDIEQHIADNEKVIKCSNERISAATRNLVRLNKELDAIG